MTTNIHLDDIAVPKSRKKRFAALAAVAACGIGAAFVPISGATHATAANSEGLVCTDGTTTTVGGITHRAFAITATDGFTVEPDGNAIYDWSYTARGSFQLPGPVLCANTGEVIDVTLTNNLPVATSIEFPGQSAVTWFGGVRWVPVGPVVNASGELLSLAPIAAANGGSVRYSFTASTAGTFAYRSGTDPTLQVQMGLFGAIVVRPSGVTITADDILAAPGDGGATGTTTNAALGMTAGEAATAAANAACAYASATDATKCDPFAIYQRDHENLMLLSEVDPQLHGWMESHKTDPSVLNLDSYPGAYEAHYFMINGRSMPDTIAPNNAAWLPNQPYGALATVEPFDVHINPLDAMIRYVGMGTKAYSFHPHSNHERVIANDGTLLDFANGHNNTEEKFDIMVVPGGTLDATFRWTNEEQYSDSDGNRLPVTWPKSLNLTEGDLWSGSPYLGQSGTLNPGILTSTQCGEYYHVAHSHDLTQVTNYGVTFGGMLTLIKVEPPLPVQQANGSVCGAA